MYVSPKSAAESPLQRDDVLEADDSGSTIGKGGGSAGGDGGAAEQFTGGLDPGKPGAPFHEVLRPPSGPGTMTHCRFVGVPSKAESPMLDTDAGRVIEARAVVCWKAALPMDCSDDPATQVNVCNWLHW